MATMAKVTIDKKMAGRTKLKFFLQKAQQMNKG